MKGDPSAATSAPIATEQANIQAVQQIYADFGRGDVPDILPASIPT